MPTRTITLTDHDQIRAWAEARGGTPSAVIRTARKNDPGILRIDFPGYSGEGSLEAIGWDEFFEKFDAANLALIVQERTAGGQRSNFNKLVRRETAQGRRRGGVGTAAKKKAAAKRTTRPRTAAKKKAATSRSRPKARAGRTTRTTRATGKKTTARRTPARRATSRGR